MIQVQGNSVPLHCPLHRTSLPSNPAVSPALLAQFTQTPKCAGVGAGIGGWEQALGGLLLPTRLLAPEETYRLRQTNGLRVPKTGRTSPGMVNGSPRTVAFGPKMAKDQPTQSGPNSPSFIAQTIWACTSTPPPPPHRNCTLIEACLQHRHTPGDQAVAIRCLRDHLDSDGVLQGLLLQPGSSHLFPRSRTPLPHSRHRPQPVPLTLFLTLASPVAPHQRGSGLGFTCYKGASLHPTITTESTSMEPSR